MGPTRALPLLLFAFGCESVVPSGGLGGGEGEDAGVPTLRDIETPPLRDFGPPFGDLGPDAEPDVGPDAEPDVGPDAEPDVGPDAEPDVGPDAGPATTVAEAVQAYCTASCDFVRRCGFMEPPECLEECTDSLLLDDGPADPDACTAVLTDVGACLEDAECDGVARCIEPFASNPEVCQPGGPDTAVEVQLGNTALTLRATTTVTFSVTAPDASTVFIETASNASFRRCSVDLVLTIEGDGPPEVVDNDTLGFCESAVGTPLPEGLLTVTVESFSGTPDPFWIRFTPQ